MYLRYAVSLFLPVYLLRVHLFAWRTHTEISASHIHGGVARTLTSRTTFPTPRRCPHRRQGASNGRHSRGQDPPEGVPFRNEEDLSSWASLDDHWRRPTWANCTTHHTAPHAVERARIGPSFQRAGTRHTVTITGVVSVRELFRCRRG